MVKKSLLLALLISISMSLVCMEGYCLDLRMIKISDDLETEKLIEIPACTTAECKDALSDLDNLYLKLEKQLSDLAKEAPDMDKEHQENMASVLRDIDLNQTELSEGNCIYLRPIANDLAIFTANYYSVLETEDKEILDLEDDITKSVEELNNVEERILQLQDTTKQPPPVEE